VTLRTPLRPLRFAGKIIRHLPAFAVAAEEQHFQRAAERLNVDQSAVSRRMRSLEQALGVTLFERRADGARLTEPGRLFQAHVIQILAAVETAGETAERAQEGKAGALKVGFIEMALREPAIAAHLKAFQADHREVEVRYMPMLTEAQMDDLEAGRIDAGFVLDVDQGLGLLERRTVMVLDLLVVLPSDHPLAGEPEVRLLQLRDEPLIWPSRAVIP
jgi:DNA-binding transcriptional LysR family regulator